MSVFRVEVSSRRPGAEDRELAAELAGVGIGGIRSVRSSRLYLIEGELSRDDAVRVGRDLLADPITESAAVWGEQDPVSGPVTGLAMEVLPRPGVMDPVAESALAELRSEGLAVTGVRTGRRLVVDADVDGATLVGAVTRSLANDCVEQVVLGTVGVAPAPRPAAYELSVRQIELRGLDDAGLEGLSRAAHLFLSLDEMKAVRSHFAAAGRAPTDLELETVAQTWSEHCVHKTLKSAVSYRGAAMPGAALAAGAEGEVELRYGNLLAETIVGATRALAAAGRGPQCLSVFQDNAGVVAFDETYGIAFKVETHNHPSAIEPYGGAATGVGGCIRDVIGCGLGARPIANTDVFCVAPPDWPQAALPGGVLHPWRVLRGVVRGVADYGNRMGIPTVNGAIHFDPRYLGNPLVFCGCVGLIPRDRIEKRAQAGDWIVLVGGRTGRDGIHGATFSSSELTETHADEFSHAVQIGNAITEKRVLDAVLRARDAEGGCLYSAITDCGAGGLSSAVGEMAEHVGATVELERVPLKYAGLRYDEIWISEAQERMVLAVPPASLERLRAIMREEEAEATVIGRFGYPGGVGSDPGPRLRVRYGGVVVGDLDLAFLHGGVPRRERVAEWRPARRNPAEAHRRDSATGDAGTLDELGRLLSHPTIASKAWVFRRYDHEVQGGSVIKPACGRGAGPADAAVLRPRLDGVRAVAVGCGLAPQLADADPYWMAAAAIDEAVRNVVCVGGAPGQTAILDNFCWGRSDDPRQLGALVRACQACHDTALAFGTPFISGKDSLNNEFALDRRDVERLVAELRGAAPIGVEAEGWAASVARIADTGRLSIPPTLLISALSIVPDSRRAVTSDLKRAGEALWLVGGQPALGFDLAAAAAAHAAVGRLIAEGAVSAAHDSAEGGWLVAVAEMAIGGVLGVELAPEPEHAPGSGVSAILRRPAPFDAIVAGYVLTTGEGVDVRGLLGGAAPVWRLGTVRGDDLFRLGGAAVTVGSLAASWSWRGPSAGAQARP